MGFEKVLDNSIVDGEVVDVTYINKKYIHLKNRNPQKKLPTWMLKFMRFNRFKN